MKIFVIGLMLATGCATTSVQQQEALTQPSQDHGIAGAKFTGSSEEILDQFDKCMGFDEELSPSEQADRVVICLSKI